MRFDSTRQAKRIIVALIGSTVLFVGIAMLVLPGPGWLVIFFGLTILSAEFVWAQRLLRRLKQAGQTAKDWVSPSRSDGGDSSRPS